MYAAYISNMCDDSYHSLLQITSPITATSQSSRQPLHAAFINLVFTLFTFHLLNLSHEIRLKSLEMEFCLKMLLMKDFIGMSCSLAFKHAIFSGSNTLKLGGGGGLLYTNVIYIH